MGGRVQLLLFNGMIFCKGGVLFFKEFSSVIVLLLLIFIFTVFI